MLSKPLVAGLALPFALMGCVTMAPPPAPAPIPGDLTTCTSQSAQNLVGTNISTINTSLLAASVRVLAPNSPATMDYNPARLNIETDGNGTILRLSCG